MSNKAKSRIVLTEELTEDNQRGKGEGRIVTKPGSRRLYVDLHYFGKRLEKSTGLEDTPANRGQISKWLDRVMMDIHDGRFRFAEAFPNASDVEKEYFAKLEGWDYNPEAKEVLFKDFLISWRKDVLDKIKSHTKKEDYRCALESQIERYFADMTFFQITSVTLQKFVAGLTHTRGSKVGQPLSEKRIKNILIVLRSVWETACEVHRWELPDPFKALARETSKADSTCEEAIDLEDLVDDEFEEELDEDFLDGDIPTDRLPLRFREWQLVYQHLDECNRLNAEFMLLTGAIASEMAALERRHIRDGYIYIRQSIVRGKFSKRVKTKYRLRKIRITEAIQRVLDQVLARAKGRFIFTRPSGLHLCPIQFSKKWKLAVKKAGISHRVPYALRHSFAAYCLALGLNPNRVVSLMGHGTKQMVYERYGRYVEGLDEDCAAIKAFFGEDFIEGARLELVSPKSDSGRHYNSGRHGGGYQYEEGFLPVEQAC